jgi:signal peptidase II
MRVLFLTLGVLIADQLTKVLVKGISLSWLGISHEGMRYGESYAIFGDWFKFTYIENPHMAFGIDVVGKVFLILFAIVASAAIIVLLYRHRTDRLVFRVSLACILAGAVGNLIDRIFHGVLYGTAGFFEGNVVDFIDLDLFIINLAGSSFKFWPIFNIADMAVSVGVVLLLITGLPQKLGSVEQPSESTGA